MVYKGTPNVERTNTVVIGFAGIGMGSGTGASK